MIKIMELQMMKTPKFTKNGGFTLIELVIVVGILGILSAVAIPSYFQYITRTNRVDAQEKLTEVMFEQERFQLRRRSYTTELEDLGYASDANILSSEGYYQISAQQCPDSGLRNCVLLIATPTPGGKQDTPTEVPLTLDSRGQKTGPWKK